MRAVVLYGASRNGYTLVDQNDSAVRVYVLRIEAAVSVGAQYLDKERRAVAKKKVVTSKDKQKLDNNNNVSGAPDDRFPVVGIGASAGGLEAFEQFFRDVSSECGMAFVLVSHLDPTHASLLTEILQRNTKMPVVEAQDQMRIEVDHVYVIPPNRDMAIFHRMLLLSEPVQPRGQRMPIDAFLRSLAEDIAEQSIGIILSGTGTDGTLGLRSIIGVGGVSLVQEPETAKYEGMPNSAIQAGYATYILPPSKMPDVLRNNVGSLALKREAPAAPTASTGLHRILMLMRSTCGHDFSLYKKSTIGRRIERRMLQHEITDIDIYARYLKENPAELHALFKELLINVTSFFRDPDAFVVLKQDILPQLFSGKPGDYVFRVWVAGCASGEEAYSIAIVLREHMDQCEKEYKVQLYATDLDDDAIAIARSGLFPPNIGQDVSPERLRRFFSKEETGYRVKKETREMVVFATQSAIKDPPFTRLDLLSCRNLMIYLEPELQNRLIPIFHYALKPGGVLFLSPSEGIGNHLDLFTPVNRKWKFYRVIPTANTPRTLISGKPTWTGGGGSKAPEEFMKKNKEPNFAELTRQILLQSYAPPSVVTDLKGNILFVHGETGDYLRPAPGQASLNLVDMARNGLQLALRAALQGSAENAIGSNQNVDFKVDGEVHSVNIRVRSLSSPEAGHGFFLVSFLPAAVTTKAKPVKKGKTLAAAENNRIEQLEQDLAYTKENLQATIEEQQASNEELKSTNEELQSTNEELQSTNEELETSKEELQSVNEELITVNAELQSKIEQLASMQNDMKNLLDNINIGTIFLDDELVIRRYTRDAVRLYRLIEADVGRPLSDIQSDIEDNDLLSDARIVLDTLVPCEREMRTVKDEHFLARIQPYRTMDNVIEGVVMTFTDITERVKATVTQEEARALELAAAVVNTVHEPLVVLDSTLRVVSASRSFYECFHECPGTTMNKPIYQLGNNQWDVPALRELLENVLVKDQLFEGYVVQHEFPNIGHRKMILNARRVVGSRASQPLILLAIECAA